MKKSYTLLKKLNDEVEEAKDIEIQLMKIGKKNVDFNGEMVLLENYNALNYTERLKLMSCLHQLQNQTPEMLHTKRRNTFNQRPPNFEISKNNMAITLTALGTKVKLEGDINQGVTFYKKALYYNWHYPDAMYKGCSWRMLEFGLVIGCKLSFHFNPHCAEACNNLGIYKDRDNLDRAIECYQVKLEGTSIYISEGWWHT